MGDGKGVGVGVGEGSGVAVGGARVGVGVGCSGSAQAVALRRNALTTIAPASARAVRRKMAELYRSRLSMQHSIVWGKRRTDRT